MFGAMLMAGMAGVTQVNNPALAQQGLDMAQHMAGRASEVTSHYVGGMYTRVSYAGGKEVDTPDHPQSAGLNESVSNPVPFLWASGGSMEPIINAAWRSNQKIKVKKITTSNLEDLKSSNRTGYNPPEQLQFPKLMGLCLASHQNSSQFCTDPMTLMELLLTPEDVTALAPNLSTSVQDIDMYRKTYGSHYLILTPGNGGGTQIWGADPEGAVYPLSPNSTAWVARAR
jgi:hypothetical protein